MICLRCNTLVLYQVNACTVNMYMYMYILFPFQILQLEAGLLRSEQERDKVLESAFHARSQSQTKITQLRTIIQVLYKMESLVYMYTYNVHTCTCTLYMLFMTCVFVCRY